MQLDSCETRRIWKMCKMGDVINRYFRVKLATEFPDVKFIIFITLHDKPGDG